jgi:hypothetical protein
MRKRLVLGTAGAGGTLHDDDRPTLLHGGGFYRYTVLDGRLTSDPWVAVDQDGHLGGTGFPQRPCHLTQVEALGVGIVDHQDPPPGHAVRLGNRKRRTQGVLSDGAPRLHPPAQELPRRPCLGSDMAGSSL